VRLALQDHQHCCNEAHAYGTLLSSWRPRKTGWQEVVENHLQCISFGKYVSSLYIP
jgi:hypothetical protein